ncbi:MAG: hypothetical protein ACHP78_14380, partial [Terriglobales bacterium]
MNHSVSYDITVIPVGESGPSSSLATLGISPAGSDARKTAQLAKKIRSLYTGKLPERIHYLGNVLAAWATMR